MCEENGVLNKEHPLGVATQIFFELQKKGCSIEEIQTIINLSYVLKSY
jgi:hypothetical protein